MGGYFTLIAAPPTSFREDGALDCSAIAPLEEHLAAAGVDGVFVNGTTGEGMLLTPEERRETAEEWRRVLPEGMRFFVHVGYAALGTARGLAAHALDTGADAVAAILPPDIESNNIDEAAAWCAGVASAVPGLPFYLYYMPERNNVYLNVARFLERAGSRIPSLAGVKFTFGDLDDYSGALQVGGGKYEVFWGRDEKLLDALKVGARGAVGSTYSIAAPLYRELIAAYSRRDMKTAESLQEKAVEMIGQMLAEGSIFAGIKSRLREQGIPILPKVRSE
ncbi:MAG: dihydrodipicolinate synthase family protein [Kiritimatiellia bacterium]